MCDLQNNHSFQCEEMGKDTGGFHYDSFCTTLLNSMCILFTNHKTKNRKVIEA